METKNKKSLALRIWENKATPVAAVFLAVVVLFLVLFFTITAVMKGKNEPESEESRSDASLSAENTEARKEDSSASPMTAAIPAASDTTAPATAAETAAATAAPTTVLPETDDGNIDFPSDTASWQLICLNRNRRVGSAVEKALSLSYVAGSSEQMDSRAAAAYDRMYAAAAQDGIYLTPCSGYRSYSTQKRLYYEFVNDYLADGYRYEEAENLASRRRNPPGSSEHNIGICMDIICAASSANFQNTDAYEWLCENAADYGFILRYPEEKESVTGVKFEPWHWRYVGAENAALIKASGLCLEEYLGLAA